VSSFDEHYLLRRPKRRSKRSSIDQRNPDVHSISCNCRCPTASRGAVRFASIRPGRHGCIRRTWRLVMGAPDRALHAGRHRELLAEYECGEGKHVVIGRGLTWPTAGPVDGDASAALQRAVTVVHPASRHGGVDRTRT